MCAATIDGMGAEFLDRSAIISDSSAILREGNRNPAAVSRIRHENLPSAYFTIVHRAGIEPATQ
jgi:hypothetical protein